METEFCTELIGFIIVWFAMWARTISTRTLSVLLVEDIVNAHSNSDNNGSDKPTQLLSQVTQAHCVENL